MSRLVMSTLESPCEVLKITLLFASSVPPSCGVVSSTKLLIEVLEVKVDVWMKTGKKEVVWMA